MVADGVSRGSCIQTSQAPSGATEQNHFLCFIFYRPFRGFFSNASNPRLTPWATLCRASGADCALKCEFDWTNNFARRRVKKMKPNRLKKFAANLLLDGSARPMTRRRKLLLGFGLAFIAAVLLVFAYCYVYEPLKFRYFVYRVESAHTADEERRAFTLAANWGRVWEVDRLSPKDMAADGKKITGDW